MVLTCDVEELGELIGLISLQRLGRQTATDLCQRDRCTGSLCRT